MEANKTYNDWDHIAIVLMKDEKNVATLKMHRSDIDGLVELHGIERGEVIDMAVKAIEEDYKVKVEEENDNK
jgi:hypothetical protein